MRLWPEARLLGLLRRIAVALEDANEIARAKSARPRASKLVEIGAAKTSDWNDHWRELHDAPGGYQPGGDRA